MIQSTLPDSLVEETIRDLAIGETAFTVPWAMFADRPKRLWIILSYPFTLQPHGTMQMEIRRTAQGVQVKSSTLGDFRYTPEELGTESDYLPVELV